MHELDDALAVLDELLDEELLIVLSTLLEEEEINIGRDYPDRNSRMDMIYYLLTFDAETDDDIDLKQERIDLIVSEDWADELN